MASAGRGEGIPPLSGSRGWQIGVGLCVALAASCVHAADPNARKPLAEVKTPSVGKLADRPHAVLPASPVGGPGPASHARKSLADNKAEAQKELTPPTPVKFEVRGFQTVDRFFIIEVSDMTVSLTRDRRDGADEGEDEKQDGKNLTSDQKQQRKNSMMEIITPQGEIHCHRPLSHTCDFHAKVSGLYTLRVENGTETIGHFTMEFTPPVTFDSLSNPPHSLSNPPHK
jgi:hypothetical protein